MLASLDGDNNATFFCDHNHLIFPLIVDEIALIRFQIFWGETLDFLFNVLILNKKAERGLTLSVEKTKLTHIDDGFDFLGFNHRKYKGKLLIKPSKSNTLLFLRNLRELIKKHASVHVNDLIKLINPKLRGWANYYRHCVAKQVFGY